MVFVVRDTASGKFGRGGGERIRHLAGSLGEAERLLDGASEDGEASEVTHRFRASLSELTTAYEELRQQNDALIAAQDALEAERERSRDLFEHAPDAYISTDMHGIIRECNIAAEELVGRQAPRLIGKPLRLILRGEGRGAFAQMWVTLQRRGEVRDAQLPFLARDGSRHMLSISARTFPRGHAQPQLVRWHLRDVSERAAREEEVGRLNAELEARVRARTVELEQALAAKDVFLGLISHELKTPITVIGGNADVLQRQGEAIDPQTRAEALADIRAESARLHRVVDDLLVLARLGHDEQAPREPVRLDLLIAAALRHHASVFPARPIETRLVPHVIVDAIPIYVEQVMRNLIGNAEKYSAAAQPIEVTLDTAGDDAVVAVKDRGCGVDPEEADAIFAPFYRSERTANTPGTGIGLAVSRRLAEAQQGRLWATPREGGGSVFTFTLPLDGEVAPPERAD
jgi:PAS domain S-box-containing protein